MPRPTAIDAAARFRQQLEAQEVAAFQRMATIYGGILRGVQDEIAALAEDIASFDIPDREKVIKLARLGRILDQIEAQVTRFGGTVTSEIALAQRLAIESAVSNATELIELSLPPGLPDDVLRAIRGSFVTLPADAIEAAAGLLADDSPLVVALDNNYGPAVRERVAQQFLNGVGEGMNPRRIAIILNRNFTNALGNGLTWAMTTVRTAQIKSYQLANHAMYQANPDLVPAWIWHSALDSRTCMSCIAQHGGEHPLTETLNDHHAGRCAALPKTITFADLGLNIPERREPTVRGEDWFKAQPAADQIALMGPAKYRAWKEGQFEFRDLSRPYDDQVYGELLREASLKDVLGNAAKDYYRGGPKGGPPRQKPLPEPPPTEPVLTEQERYTPDYFDRLNEHENNVAVAETIREFDASEADSIIAESLDLVRLEEDISSAARAFDYVPGRMSQQDWLALSDDLEKETGRLLKFSTEARRAGAGEKLRGPAATIAQVGGQDKLIKDGAISARDARRIAQKLGQSSQERATVYLESRLLRYGYSSDDIADLSENQKSRLEQIRRLLAEIGHGEGQKGNVDKVPRAARDTVLRLTSEKQKLESMSAARQPRTMEGLDLWELYKEATVRAGLDEPPYIPDELWGVGDETTPDYIERSNPL